ncbi:MAG: prolyl oligopeptidase family serine peptidase [Gemmatimonadota bacterium]|jgi:dipeptidyl aminopeptidase/acylaminoacyl peptidase
MIRRHGATLVLAPALAGLALGPAPATGQAPTGGSTALYEPEPARDQMFQLNIRNIMRGPELVGQEPAGVRFSDDSEWIYFRWLPGGHEWNEDRELYRVPAEGGEPELVPEEEEERLALELADGDLSSDGSLRVVSMDGDLWVVDRRDGSSRRLTETRAGEGSPFFGPDDERVFFREGDNVFSMGLDGSGLRQVTDIRSGSPPSDEAEAEGQRAFLEEQQEELFEHIRRQAEERERRDSIQEARSAEEPEPVWVPRGERLGGVTPSPDGSRALLSTFRPAQGDRATPVPFWITESGYTETRDVRNKVGDAQGSQRVGFVDTSTGETTWLEAKPEDYEGEVSSFHQGWNDAGTHALIVSGSENNEDAWLYTLDAATGELTLLEHVHDDAWVAGPCRFGCEGWIPGTDRAYYVTEATGWAHLYTISADGTGKRQLTDGEWEVLDVEIPEGADRFLLTTNEGSPFNQLVAWMDFDGGEREYLTRGDGSYDVTLSPDLERMALVHSVANRPPELFVAPADDAEAMEQVTVSPTEDWLSFPWIRPEIVWFQAEDGTRVPARIYRPSDMGAEPNRAAVIFVHGAGYLHNVHNYWSSYYREYMFNHLLAASGYTVMDIDYRGSAGYGRDWRTAIYRHMGGKDLSDQVDGARWLVANEDVDAERIGIYGGSYGGFITLMALFTAGDTFKSGAALRSVTDWAHYNHPYTANILNTPQEDPEAYEQSSPIYFAEGLRPDQHLLIAHGMVDTNVHFSDVVRLAQRLIELGKENWEMAVYPAESHGFVEPTSWIDEYRRIYELFERTISEPGCTDDGGFCPVPRAAVTNGG